jgi:hypothetical protein
MTEGMTEGTAVGVGVNRCDRRRKDRTSEIRHYAWEKYCKSTLKRALQGAKAEDRIPTAVTSTIEHDITLDNADAVASARRNCIVVDNPKVAI